MEMIRKLEAVNKALKKQNFKATIRLSEMKSDVARSPRWDEKFIESELVADSGSIRKVWVCGPPSMNETFDKALGGLAQKL